MELLVSLVTIINAGANALGSFFLSPIALLPGWISINIISAVLGVLLLLIFKYTSNQKTISRIRDDIKANMLAIKLFKGSISVAFKSQRKIFFASFKLLFHSIVPMLVMILPVSFILSQMGMWYQARPVQLNDDPIIVKMKLNDGLEVWPEVTLQTGQAIQNIIGPVRVLSKKEIYWKIKPIQNGYNSLIFKVGTESIKKQLATGDGFMRLSNKRPGQNIADIFLYPLEKPIPRDSIVHSIIIDYPSRDSRMYGTNWWLIYFFIASMMFALIFKPFLKVRI
ncbi:MAG: hypothetical protein HF978_07285 [Desulfobacteraceae bacterium]|nr:hypothetical protein [Desulfobacteraceae bacterium]MBC2755334.1 hypothetical protein [Desulfobacteraceae bacterium]